MGVSILFTGEPGIFFSVDVFVVMIKLNFCKKLLKNSYQIKGKDSDLMLLTMKYIKQI